MHEERPGRRSLDVSGRALMASIANGSDRPSFKIHFGQAGVRFVELCNSAEDDERVYTDLGLLNVTRMRALLDQTGEVARPRMFPAEFCKEVAGRLSLDLRRPAKQDPVILLDLRNLELIDGRHRLSLAHIRSGRGAVIWPAFTVSVEVAKSCLIRIRVVSMAGSSRWLTRPEVEQWIATVFQMAGKPAFPGGR